MEPVGDIRVAFPGTRDGTVIATALEPDHAEDAPLLSMAFTFTL